MLLTTGGGCPFGRLPSHDGGGNDHWVGKMAGAVSAIGRFPGVKTGDLGGFVEDTVNLSTENDSSWIFGDAIAAPKPALSMAL